jgi:hypothetical protein
MAEAAGQENVVVLRGRMPRFARVPTQALAVRLPAEALRVLIAICLHADRDWHSRPSRKRLAGESRVASRHLLRNLRLLEAEGLISRDGDNSYIVHWDFQEDAGDRDPSAGQRPEAGPDRPEAGPDRPKAGPDWPEAGPANARAIDEVSKALNRLEQKAPAGGMPVAVDGRSAPSCSGMDGADASAAARDPTAYQAAIKERKWRRWLNKVNGCISRMSGSERLQAWKDVATASSLPDRAAVPAEVRHRLDAIWRRFGQ